MIFFCFLDGRLGCKKGNCFTENAESAYLSWLIVLVWAQQVVHSTPPPRRGHSIQTQIYSMPIPYSRFLKVQIPNVNGVIPTSRSTSLALSILAPRCERIQLKYRTPGQKRSPQTVARKRRFSTRHPVLYSQHFARLGLGLRVPAMTDTHPFELCSVPCQARLCNTSCADARSRSRFRTLGS